MLLTELLILIFHINNMNDILCEIKNIFPDDDLAVIQINDKNINLDYKILEFKIIR
jgi:hypothetical protein